MKPTFPAGVRSTSRTRSPIFDVGLLLLILLGLAVSAQSAAAATCSPAITPYLKIGSGAWQQIADATVSTNASVSLGPQPISGGSWKWSGPGGYTSSSRQITVIVPTTAVYTATYINASACTSTQKFTLTVVTPTPTPTATPACNPAITPYVRVGSGAWQQTANATITAGSSVSLGPQPISGGSWNWSGPGEFTSTSRQITVTVSNTSIYTATYINVSNCTSKLPFTLTVSGSPTPTPTPTATATATATPTATPIGVNVLTQHNDNARSGANLDETILTPANVTVRKFGMLFKRSVDDQVYGQPLYVSGVTIGGGTHNVIYVTTVNNSVYAFDADNASVTAPYWHVNFGKPQSASDGLWNCTDVNGNMGIIGTPVIDRNSDTLYVVARTNESSGFFNRLHALYITTGKDKAGSPVRITTSGFDSHHNNQRPALLLSNGVLYVGYGSHCDEGPYKGWLFGFNASTLAQVSLFDPEPNSDGASIWQSGQGPATDASGNIYFGTSNGTWDGSKNFSETVLKLSSNLTLLDWFTPSNYQSLDNGDLDLNSSGVMLIPGTSLAVITGKQGVMYVVDINNLGHLGDSNAVQSFQATTGTLLGSPVYWDSAANGPMIYVWGVNDKLKVYKVSGGMLNTSPAATSTFTQAYPGGFLSISADGNTNGIVWAYTAPKNAEHSSGAGVLRALNADDVATELWNSTQNATRDNCNNISKNAAPTIANGKVYLASFGTANTGSGQLCVYGLQ